MKCEAISCRKLATRTVGRKWMCDQHAKEFTRFLNDIFKENDDNNAK